MCNILILFDSDTQKNEDLAKISKKVLSDLNVTAEVRRVVPIGQGKNTEEHYVSDVSIVKEDDLKWADAYIFSFPIHTGTISASMKYFFDSYHEVAMTGVFKNKPATVMSVGKITHAGAETGTEQIYSMLMQWGSLIVSTSILSTQLMLDNGNPYGLSFILDKQNTFGDTDLLNTVLQNHFNRFIHITESIHRIEGIELDSTCNKAYTIVDTLN